jgi:hypothetical protein
MIKLKEKMKEYEEFLDLVERISNIDGGYNFINDLRKVILDTIRKIKQEIDLTNRNSEECKLLLKLDEIRLCLYEEEPYESLESIIGNEFWIDLYSDGSAGDM